MIVRPWLLVLSLLIGPACGGGEPSGGEPPTLSPEKRAEIRALVERLEAIDPDPSDPQSRLDARHEHWRTLYEIAGWARAHQRETGDTIWGNDCETRCWADWWLCVDACPKGDDGVHIFMGTLPGSEAPDEEGSEASPTLADSPGFGHDPDDCWQDCDEEHDRCMKRCEIITRPLLRP